MRLLIAAIILALLPACTTTSSLQSREQATNINPGMTKQEVLKAMGPPSNRQFEANRGNLYEALHWDLGWDEGLMSNFDNKKMVLVYFANGKVTGLENYVAIMGRVKRVNWEDAPDFILETRAR